MEEYSFIPRIFYVVVTQDSEFFGDMKVGTVPYTLFSSLLDSG